MERKENVPWSWQDTVGAIALLAIVAVLFLQLGFLSSARKGEMKDGEDRTQSTMEEQILAVQDSERLLAENLVENPRRFPDPLILDSTYRENWAIRDGHLNGMPYEVRSLTARESPKKVVSRYTQRFAVARVPRHRERRGATRGSDRLSEEHGRDPSSIGDSKQGFGFEVGSLDHLIGPHEEPWRVLSE